MLRESEAFEIAFTKTLVKEGFSSNVLHDSGGATKYGISKKFLETITAGPVSNAYVLGLSLADAKDIYRVHFWISPKFSKIPNDKIREIVFDQGVNRGTGTAVKLLQSAINRTASKNLLVDGVLGPKTLNTIGLIDTQDLSLSFMRECQLSYVRLCQKKPTQLKFLAGWIDRTWTYI